MTLLCRNCSRANPPEARYCYYDGAVLDGAGGQSGPIAIAVQPFPAPFVFPSGRPCRNYDELVRACDSEWDAARELLSKGYLEAFLGGLGRADLALAARQSAAVADLDRGLDQLLTKLPCSQRDAARMFVQPQEVNLGQVSRSGDRFFELHIENQGYGLLYGSVATDKTDWLMLGEGAGSPRKVFQFHHDFVLRVQVIGRRLRGAQKPIEGRLSIESNGGTASVVVRLEVPIKPFPEGVLAGASTPRQVAEKAKAHPKPAGVLFEKGAVVRWYEDNGWTYPVQGPAATGIGAVQQFFEALGLVTPPKVEISEERIALQGEAGAAVEHVLHVRTQEKRPVFAYATTNTPWLQIGRVALDGRTARIPVRVPVVPACPGQELEGKVQVTANGHQRFAVDVKLTVLGRPAVPVQKVSPGAVLSMGDVLAAAPMLSAADVVDAPVYEVTAADIPAVPVVVVREERVAPARPRPAPTVLPVVEDEEEPAPAPAEEPGGFAGWAGKHLVPLAIFALILLIPLIHDLVLKPEARVASEPDLVDLEPYVAIQYPSGTGSRFGLVMLRERDPKNHDKLKRLTFDEYGRSNNTCVRVDQDPPALFGSQPGAWVKVGEKLPDELGHPRRGTASIWKLAARDIWVTQEVELVPGVQSRRLDTCLVRYMIKNRDAAPHSVGLRFMLDTFIGANDGVPFTIPGQRGLCDTMARFDRPEDVPDFIQALENEDLSNPGTVAYLQFRVSSQIESPSRVLLGGWPDQHLQLEFPPPIPQARGPSTSWDVPYISMRELAQRAERKGARANPDSAVTMYWDPREIPAGGSRVVGFTYGLGNVASGESGGRILLTVGGRLVHDGEFTLTALVHGPEPGESLQLTLPEGFKLLEGSLEQTVPAVEAGARRSDSPVTWRIRAGDDGAYELKVRSSTGTTQKLPITIRTRGVFD
jgi:hypothetical protein